MSFSHLSIAKKGLLLVSMPLISGIVFTAALFSLLQQSAQDLTHEINAKELVGVVNQLSVHMIDAATARAALQIKRLQTDANASTYWLNKSRGDILKLKLLVQGNQEETEKVFQLESLLEGATRDVEQVMNQDETPTTLSGLVDPNQLGLADSYVTRLIDLTESLLVPANRIDREGPLVRKRDRRCIELSLFGAVCLNVLLTFGLAMYFSRNITQRLKNVKANAILITKKLPLRPSIGGSDEIAVLDGAFHKAADELERLEKNKQDLVAVVSHELKTPLSAVQGIFYLAGQGAFGTMTSAAQEAVIQAEKQSGQLILIVNDLLDLEKLEAAKVELTLKKLSIDAIVNEALVVVRAYAERQGVSIETSLSAVPIQGDATYLSRAVENFLVNALLRSHPGSVVKVSSCRVGGYAEIKIEDEAAETIKASSEEIFSRFYRFEPAATGPPRNSSQPEPPGYAVTALGLPIARALVELHQGSAGFAKLPGQGNVFWIKLPTDNA